VGSSSNQKLAIVDALRDCLKAMEALDSAIESLPILDEEAREEVEQAQSQAEAARKAALDALGESESNSFAEVPR